MLRRNLLLTLSLGTVFACAGPLAAAETHPSPSTTCSPWTGFPTPRSPPTAARWRSSSGRPTSPRTADARTLAPRREDEGGPPDDDARGGRYEPRWSADGKSLWFLSTRGGSQQVWNLPLSVARRRR